MKNTIRFTLILAAVAITFAACEKDEPIIDNGSNNVVVDNPAIERVILYSVGTSETRRTLARESEWDALLEQFCEQTLDGSEVTFYNINPTTYLQASGKSGAKENRNISTSNREELKTWMKEMERQGLTVRISYDDNTGTWNGVAYVTAPAGNTMGDILGTWHFTRMVVTQLDAEGHLVESNLYEPEAGGGSWYYTFVADSTVVLTINGMGGTTATDNGTWTLSNDGVLSSELMPNGVNWNVNWISSGTMILSHSNLGTEEGDYLYQLQFEKVQV